MGDPDDFMDDDDFYSRDDILEDIDDDFEEIPSASPMKSRVVQRPAAKPCAEILAGAVRTPFGFTFMSLEDAVNQHHVEGIHKAAARGETLPPEVDPIMLVAKGTCPDELDHAHHQSAESVESTLIALTAIGVDLNEDRDGVPAAHRVSKYYGDQIIGNFYDTSQAAELGMTDQSQGSRLAAFARAGVDFNAKDEDGQKPIEAVVSRSIEKANELNANVVAVKSYVTHECMKAHAVSILQKKHGLDVDTRGPRKAADRSKRSGPSLDD